MAKKQRFSKTAKSILFPTDKVVTPCCGVPHSESVVLEFKTVEKWYDDNDKPIVEVVTNKVFKCKCGEEYKYPRHTDFVAEAYYRVKRNKTACDPFNEYMAGYDSRHGTKTYIEWLRG